MQIPIITSIKIIFFTPYNVLFFLYCHVFLSQFLTFTDNVVYSLSFQHILYLFVPHFILLNHPNSPFPVLFHSQNSPCHLSYPFFS